MQVMVGKISRAPQGGAPEQHAIYSGCVSLMLDRQGRILSCGAPTEKLLAASQIQLMGRGISEFIGGLLPGGSAPKHGANYIGHLCADGEWRKFKAQDVGGREFIVELNVSQMITNDQEIFLLNMHRWEGGSFMVSPGLSPQTNAQSKML